MRSILIVGASLAGLSAARGLRRRGFDGTITLVGEELHRPYQRPPLSKQFFGEDLDRARIAMRVEEGLGLEWHLGARAASLDLARREVGLADGARLAFDGLVIATGARARRPRWYAELQGIFTLRTVDDALALRAHLKSGQRKVAIVGAGFIGSEVAATLRSQDCDVTLIDIETLPMQRVLGEDLGAACLRLHESHGVHARLGVGVSSIVGSGSVEGLRLTDGSLVEADCVVVGIGAVPNVEWLQDSGLVLEDGLVCDAACAALRAQGVVAAGDVARWEHPAYGRIRVEHWENALAQGEAAAQTLLAPRGEAVPYAALPFFWSDQFGSKLQLIGLPRPGDRLRVVEGSLQERRFVAQFEHDGHVTGVFLFNSMHRVAAYRQVVAGGLTHLTEGAMA